MTVVMVACRTQHRLTDSRGSQGTDSVHESTAGVLTHTHTNTHLLGCVRQQSVTLGNSLVNVCVFLFVCHSQSLYIFIILPPPVLTDTVGPVTVEKSTIVFLYNHRRVPAFDMKDKRQNFFSIAPVKKSACNFSPAKVVLTLLMFILLLFSS